MNKISLIGSTWSTIVAPQDYYVGKNTTNGAASTKVCSPVVQYDEADIILVLQPQQHTKSPRAFIAKVCKKLHKIASVWCKIALGEVGMSLP